MDRLLPPEIRWMICSHFCKHCSEPNNSPIQESRFGDDNPDGISDLKALSQTSRNFRDPAQRTLFHMAGHVGYAPATRHTFYSTLKQRPDLCAYVRQFALYVSFAPRFADDGYTTEHRDEDLGLLREVGCNVLSLPLPHWVDWTMSPGHPLYEEDEQYWPERHDLPNGTLDVEDATSDGRLLDGDRSFMEARDVANALFDEATSIMALLSQLEDLYIMPIDFWNPPAFRLSEPLARLCSTIGVQSAKRVFIGTDTYFGQVVGYDAINTIVPHLSRLSHLRIRSGPCLDQFTTLKLPETSCLANLRSLQLDNFTSDGDRLSDTQKPRENGSDECNLFHLIRRCRRLGSFQISLDADGLLFEESVGIIECLYACRNTLHNLGITVVIKPGEDINYAEFGNRLAVLHNLQRLALDASCSPKQSEALDKVTSLVRRLPKTLIEFSLQLNTDGQPISGVMLNATVITITQNVPASVRTVTLQALMEAGEKRNRAIRRGQTLTTLGWRYIVRRGSARAYHQSRDFDVIVEAWRV